MLAVVGLLGYVAPSIFVSYRVSATYSVVILIVSLGYSILDSPWPIRSSYTFDLFMSALYSLSIVDLGPGFV